MKILRIKILREIIKFGWIKMERLNLYIWEEDIRKTSLVKLAKITSN